MGGQAGFRASIPGVHRIDAEVGYTDHAGHLQPFVVTEISGTWRKAGQVRGSAVLNTAGSAEVNAVSCAAPGRCSAAGYYSAGHSDSPPSQAFAVSRR